MKVCAVIVTYNREKLLLECLDALARQTVPVKQVVLIDNASTDGTAQAIQAVLASSRYPFKLIYQRLAVNTGGAGGFYEGVKRATLAGEFSDWLWLMDDDAEPSPTCLEKLLAAPGLEQYGFLAPRIIHKESGREEAYHQKIKMDLFRIKEIQKPAGLMATSLEANAFVGVLINTKAVAKVGLPDPSYFIWFDDADYTYRISRFFKPGVFVSDAVIFHKDQIFQKNSDNWKHVFGLRNRIRFYKKFAPPLGILMLSAKAFKHIAVFLAKGQAYAARTLMAELFWGDREIEIRRLK
ncbi:MAG: glycosyltransferase family 2 protein [Oligoflexia bacterium]|nr:glycosyltransferase family 2 protein [Oligoflexia bacterium]